MEGDYQNREIDERFLTLEQKMEERHADQIQYLQRIEGQTTKTNGRVNKLENWQAYIKGGLAVIVLLLVPIAIYFIQQTLSDASLHDEVQQAVTDALNSQ